MFLTREEVIGGIVGGIAASLGSLPVLWFILPDALTTQAAIYGLGEPLAQASVQVSHGVLLGLLYSVIMSLATDWYLTKLLLLTRRSPCASRGIKPLMDRFGIAVVISGLTGIQFGLGLWVVAALAVSRGGLGGADADALASGWFLLSMLLFGLILGGVYGEYIKR